MRPLRDSSKRTGARRMLGACAAVVVSMVVAFVAPAGAVAAVPGGPATVTTTVDIVSGQDLVTPISQLKANEAAPASEYRFALNIGYACGSASPCTGVTIKVDPQQLDTFYGTQRFAAYDSGTLPPGASLSGNSATAGQTISLGNLAAGASGSFTLLYTWQQRAGNTAAAQSFFLDGTTITEKVTIDATNAGATASASDSVVWHIDTKAPQVYITPGGLARVDTDYQYSVRMGTDCMNASPVGNYGEPAKLCAQSWTNTLQLPAGVTFVSATDGGTYDAGSNTVTWTKSGQAAAVGWESVSGYAFPRTVTVRFPDAVFTAGCTQDFSVSFRADVTYLDGQQKDASSTMTHKATNCAPFASVEPFVKFSSIYGPPNLVWDQNTLGTFELRLGNRANVPGVATVRDDNLGAMQQHLRIYRVDMPGGGSLDYTYTDGTSGTTTTAAFSIPAGKTLESIVAVSAPLAGPNLDQASQPNVNRWAVRLQYVTIGEAPAEGWPVTNTASATMAYPNTGLADVNAGTSTTSFVIAQRPANFYALQTSSFSGGGNPVAGQPVDYTLWGVTSEMKPDKTIEPQYVFVAPPQWNIVAGSWSLDSGAPAGAIFTQSTVTLGGQTRQALYVHWPAGTTWGMNATWPKLHVQATPAAAAPGSVGVATGFIGDASHAFPGLTAYWGSGNNNGQLFTDAPDLDGDGSTSEYFAQVGTAGYTVGAAAGLSSVKEICRANPAAADGCDWIADSSQSVAVSPIASDIKYRITLRNNGNTALTGVVAYDVLPHIGDTGTSSGSASTPRGSQFAESVDNVSNVSGNLTLSYSTSTNPCRAQVYPGGPVGCTDDWNGVAANKVAIRAAVTGTLAPGATASFVYTANVLGAPAAGSQACNSIATAAAGTPVSEPSPVCARIVAADLEVTAPATITPQLDRPTVLPFTVRNVSGSTTPPTVTVTVPAGVQVTSLTSGDWTCSGATAPVSGPATVTCSLPTPLAAGASSPLNLSAVVNVDGVSIGAAVTGPLFDPVPGNNAASITVNAAPAVSAGLAVTKDDGRAALVAGQETTYTISIRNQLTTEAVGPITVTDTLPAGLEFVSASDGGVAGAGGTVAWTLPSLAAAGGESVTLTVRVAADAAGTTLSNTVDATADDPAFPAQTLTGSATDTDQLDRISLTKSVTFPAPADPTDPHPGDVVQYRFVIANTGGGTLTDVSLTDPKPGLSAITFPDGWPSTPGRLGAGESVVGVATYTLTTDDIDRGGTSNTATVTASSAGGENVSATSSVDQPLPALAGLTLTKDAALDTTGTVHVGDRVTYTFVATNTGNSTLRDVSIADPMTGLSSLTYVWPIAMLPGVVPAAQSVRATATYDLTQADIDRGTVTNAATASAVDLADLPVSADDGAVLSIPAAPSMRFTKEGELVGDVARPVAGDQVRFSFEVQNTGNVTVSLLAIQEHLDGVSGVVFGGWPDPAAPGALAPGQSVRGTATYPLLQEDIDSGEVVNTATLTGAPARGPAIEEDARTAVSLARVSGLSIVKHAELLDADADGIGDIGERIQYSFAVENTGNVTLTDVEVVDPMVDGTPGIDALAPGETVTLAGDPYTITATDAAARRVVNTATATATAPGAQAVQSAPSTATTAVAAATDLATTGGVLTPLPAILASGALTAGVLLILVVAIRRRTARR